MKYIKPDKAIEDFTEEELQQYEEHLERQIKINKLKELEKAQKNIEQPKPQKEVSEETKIESKDSLEDVLEEFDKIIK